MSVNPIEKSFFESDPYQQGQILWEKLHPESWPIKIQELPKNSALVGGVIRDELLMRLRKKQDIDIIVPSKAIEYTQELAKKSTSTCVILDSQRDIARLVINGWTIDFGSQSGSNLEEDLLKRDFRVNAIALTIEQNPKLLDPTNGLQDLQKRQLSAVKQRNLQEDPLRNIRGLRLISQLGMSLEPKTKQWIQQNTKLLKKAAPERIQSEIQQLLDGPWIKEVIPLIQEIGLLDEWGSSLEKSKSFCSILTNLDRFKPNEKKIAITLTGLTSLLSDEGLAELRFSKKQRQRCKYLRIWQSKDDGSAYSSLNEANRLKLHKDLEQDLPALITQLPYKKQAIWLERWRDPEDPLFHPSSPVDGHTLQEYLGIPANSQLGDLMDHLCHERAFGRLKNQEDALIYSRNWWKQNEPIL